MSQVGDGNVKLFVKIKAFLNDLNTCFGTEHLDIAKYNELCKRTSITDHGKIAKHVDSIKAFILKNETAIKEDKIDEFTTDDICYTEKIKFNLKSLISISDADTKKSILTYCKVFLCMFEPDDTLKNNLMKSKKTKPEDLFKDVFAKMEQTASSGELPLSSNPADMMSSLQNGSLQSLASDIQTKLSECDEKEIVSYTEGLLSNIKEKSGNDPSLAGMFGLVDMLMSNLKSQTGDSETSTSTSYTPPDPMQMIQTLSGAGSGADANPFMASFMSNIMKNMKQ